jgi:nitrate reductase alpha subunit
MVDVWDRKAESDGQKATTTHNSSSPATTANNNKKTHSLTKAQLAAAPSQLLHATADDKAPSYVHTAGIVLSQLLLWHRALLHFQPSGALPILLSSPASSSGGHALFVREEAVRHFLLFYYFIIYNYKITKYYNNVFTMPPLMCDGALSL